MPPFIKRSCVYCHTSNTYDLLKLQGGITTVYRSVETLEREYVVTCQACKREFVIVIKDDHTDSSRGTLRGG